MSTHVLLGIILIIFIGINSALSHPNDKEISRCNFPEICKERLNWLVFENINFINDRTTNMCNGTHIYTLVSGPLTRGTNFISPNLFYQWN